MKCCLPTSHSNGSDKRGKKKKKKKKPEGRAGCWVWVSGLSAICVQRFDDSLRSAIHITYRISLRSSSLREPRYPLLKVVFYYCFNIFIYFFVFVKDKFVISQSLLLNKKNVYRDHKSLTNDNPNYHKNFEDIFIYY